MTGQVPRRLVRPRRRRYVEPDFRRSRRPVLGATRTTTDRILAEHALPAGLVVQSVPLWRKEDRNDIDALNERLDLKHRAYLREPDMLPLFRLPLFSWGVRYDSEYPGLLRLLIVAWVGRFLWYVPEDLWSENRFWSTLLLAEARRRTRQACWKLYYGLLSYRLFLWPWALGRLIWLRSRDRVTDHGRRRVIRPMPSKWVFAPGIAFMPAGGPGALEEISTLGETTLTGTITSTSTSIPVTDRSLFPQSGNFRLVIQDSVSSTTNREVILVTGGHGAGAGSFTIGTTANRGLEGTTAVGHTAPSYVEMSLTRVGLLNLIEERLGLFNVRTGYGAKGDGTTDDTTAFVNAAAAAQAVNGVVIVPPSSSSYILSNLQLPGSNVHIMGTGIGAATIQHKTAATRSPLWQGLSASTYANVTFENLRINGNGRDGQTTVASTVTIGAGGTIPVTDGTKFVNGTDNVAIYNGDAATATLVNFTGVSGNNLTGCTAGTYTAGVAIDFIGNKDGIYLNQVTDLTIRCCKITNFYNSGITVGGYQRASIRDNHIETVCLTSGNRNGITMQDFNNQPGVMTDCWIKGNYVKDGQTGGIVLTDFNSTSATLQLRTIITENIVRDWPKWSGIDSESGYLDSLTISNNQCYATMNGVHCVESEGVYGGISNSNHIICTNNLLDNHTVLDTAVYTPKGAGFAGSGVSVTSNIIRTPGTGVEAGQASAGTFNDDFSIVANRIQINCSNIRTSPGVCIALTANARTVAITGNNCDRAYARAIGAQNAVTTLTVDHVADAYATGTIRPSASATSRTYTSVTQATRAGAHATIVGLSSAVTVTDGQLIYFGNAGHAIDIGIADDVLIANNTINNPGTVGIRLVNGVQRTNVLSNTVRDTGTDMAASDQSTRSGIYFSNQSGTNDNNKAQGNTIYDTLGTMAWGIWVGGSTNTHLIDNQVFSTQSTSWGNAYGILTASNVTVYRGNCRGTSNIPNQQVARVTADVTLAGTGAQNVTGLSFSVGPNETWQFDCQLIIHNATSNIGGVKVAVTVPSGATLKTMAEGTGSAVTARTQAGLTASGTLSGVAYMTFASTGTAGSYIKLRGIVANAGTAGTVQIQAAEGTAADVNTVEANSELVANPVVP